MGLGLLHRGRLGLIMPLGQLPKETPSNEPPDFAWGRKEENKRVREVDGEQKQRVTVQIIWYTTNITV